MNRIARGRSRGRFSLSLQLDAEDIATPTFLRIARAIADDARNGRLGKGATLPGSRALAATLGVHRNTVLAAYRELIAEGFVVTKHGSGTFIVDSLPEVTPRRFQRAGASAPERSRTGFPFSCPRGPELFAPPPKGIFALYGGMPDTRLVPRDAYSRALRRALRGRTDYLSYGDPRGEATLRSALADMLRTMRGLSVSTEEVLLTRGSQMALSLIGKLLLGPRDVLAVESYGYQPAWRALCEHGASLRAIPIDEHGLKVDRLAELCDQVSVRAVYVTPHHQYPTTVTLSAGRRMQLLQLARQKRFAIIEDDYDHETHYGGRPIQPLASADDAGVVLYVGTLSKVLAPGVRLGYLVAPAPILEAASRLRFDLDRQGDRIGERALAELFEDGEMQRHLWRVRRVYHARRDHCVAKLHELFGNQFSFSVPSGGMALWIKVDRHIPVASLLAESGRRGVIFQPGQLFSFTHRPLQRIRLGYACLTEAEMHQALTRLRDAASATTRRK